MKEMNELKTGTTTVGIVVKNAVILAADQRATVGNIAYDENSKKIYTITDRVGLTNAGVVGDSLTLIRFLKSHANQYEVTRKTEMKTKAMASLLSNILNSNRYYPYMVQFILGGHTGKPELFELTPYGGILERDSYAISGSGTAFAMTVLDQNYRKDLSNDEGIRLVVKAVMASKQRDIYSGGLSINIFVIDQNGIQEISQDKIQKLIEENRKINA